MTLSRVPVAVKTAREPRNEIEVASSLSWSSVEGLPHTDHSQEPDKNPEIVMGEGTGGRRERWEKRVTGRPEAPQLCNMVVQVLELPNAETVSGRALVRFQAVYVEFA
jgi:hypothetical protein